ncbi:MAG: thioesterase family protein [Desulfuromonadaceae bacterium]|nr:thioesterase family protein [Desulfuromonadaceae bacterium]
MTDHFRYYLRVRYSDCDAQKVVFNARYAEYVDIGTVEFLRASCPDQSFFEYHLVKQTIEWKAPARFDQVLELSVYLQHLGTTSFTIITDIRVAGLDPVIARVETVNVYIDETTMQKTAIPADLGAALERGASGVVVDHAGYFGSM